MGRKEGRRNNPRVFGSRRVMAIAESATGAAGLRFLRSTRPAPEASTPVQWLGGALVDEDPLDAVQAAAPQVRTTTQAAAQEAAQVVEAAHRAQLAASMALKNVLTMEWMPDVAGKLREAKGHVDKTMAECTPQDAGHALLAAMAAHKICATEPEATNECDSDLRLPNKEITDALKCVRDFLVWKTQIRVALNDRDGFIDALRDALGEHVKQPDVFSSIMHSHTRHVAALFDRAFLSNAAYEAVRRRGVRAARHRPRGPKSSNGAVRRQAASAGPGHEYIARG